MDRKPFLEEGQKVGLENSGEKNLKEPSCGPAQAHGIRLTARLHPAGKRAAKDFEP
jgi:hypothetical protein